MASLYLRFHKQVIQIVVAKRWLSFQ